MQVRAAPRLEAAEDLELARLALDALDVGVLVLSADLRSTLHANATGAPLVAGGIPTVLRDAIDSYVLARGNARRTPPALRVMVAGRAYFLRVVAAEGAVPVEIVFLRQEVLRDVEVLRILEERFGITRREYQIVNALRLGKTNRQIAAEYGLAEGTVARHVHRLLARMSVANRTELVHLVDELVKYAG